MRTPGCLTGLDRRRTVTARTDDEPAEGTGDARRAAIHVCIKRGITTHEVHRKPGVACRTTLTDDRFHSHVDGGRLR